MRRRRTTSENSMSPILPSAAEDQPAPPRLLATKPAVPPSTSRHSERCDGKRWRSRLLGGHDRGDNAVRATASSGVMVSSRDDGAGYQGLDVGAGAALPGVRPGHAELPREAIAGLVRLNAQEWQKMLARRGDARLRPSPGTWSALECGCHVRDV